MSVKTAIANLKENMQQEGIRPETGLGNDLFLFSSTLAPVVNVDVLVVNENKEFLLSWRYDPHCGTGWHIPGGCVRFKETLKERIQKTAAVELGSEVSYLSDPVKVFEIFSNHFRPGLADQRERAHFITLVFGCRLIDENKVKDRLIDDTPTKPGQLKWFKTLPDNLLMVQECYREHWEEISRKLWREN